jgi:hypothetical protein
MVTRLIQQPAHPSDSLRFSGPIEERIANRIDGNWN